MSIGETHVHEDPYGGIPPIPARMLNEFVYCPWLGYQMWVQGEFAGSADTVEGRAKYRRVDVKAGPADATGI